MSLWHARPAALVRLVAASLLVAAPTLHAQTNTAEVIGVVRDVSGGALAGTTIRATHAATGLVVEQVAAADGRFYLPGLRTGAWELRASKPGFSTEIRSDLVLEIGRTLEVSFTLGIRSLTEAVEVTASLPLLQTTSAEISDVIGTRQLVDLPINGRNFISLAQLSGAVVLPPGGTRGDALQQAGPLPNVGGQRSGHNIYLLDGAKVTDELFNNLVISPSVDSIQEFKIQKTMYPAEFGGKASALINVATRAGSNTWRGSLFEFHRNDAFDARNYFDRTDGPRPQLRQNQFGGVAGGPVLKDRSFFFASYEGLRMNRALTRTFSVPSTALRAGDFSGLGTICDPLTIPTTGRCTPFAGNAIPASRIDPIATAFLGSVPLPTSTGTLQNLTAVEASTRRLHQLSGRLDHRLTDRDNLFARFSTFDANERQPFGTSTLQEALVPGFGRALNTSTRNLAASGTHVFGNAWLNELRVGWMHVRGGQTSENQGTDFAGAVGLRGVTADSRDVGFPQISTRGLFSTMGDPTSFVYRNNQHLELYDNVTAHRGAHRIKFGVYYFHLRLRPEQPDNARGAFTYTGQFTGNALADFLLGYPTSATSGIGRGDEDGRTNWFHAYAQDDWQLRDNLTVNLGLRYEYNQHMYDVRNRLSSVDLSTPGGRFVIASDAQGNIDSGAQALLPLIPIGYVTASAADWNRSLLSPGALRLAPRTGLALTFNDHKGVIRGGYGIYLNQWAYSVQTAFARNLPFFYTKQVDVPVDVTVPTLRTADMLAGSATGTVAPTIMNNAYQVEYSQTWSAGLQYEVVPSTMLDVSYMGTWTLGADNATVLNVPEPGPGSIQARRPIPQLSRVNAIRFDGKSIYHAVTFKVSRPLARGVAYTAGYTLSTSMDDASSPGATESESNVPQDVRNIFDESGEWAHSSFDHRHQFTGSLAYALPTFRRGGAVTAAAFSGWRLNAIVSAQSGAPFTVNLGVDQANIGAGPAQRPDQLRDPNLPFAQRTADRWFDTTAFALPAPFTFGTARRNSVTGPGFAAVDLALARNWQLGTSRLELRWEIFNLLNRANFDVPNRTFGTANFGRVFSAKSPREMQVGLHVSF